MLSQFYRFGQAAGIAIHTDQGGTPRISGCRLSVKQQQLAIEKKITGLQAISEVSKHLTAKTLVAVNLSGKGVLIRRMEKAEEITAVNFNKVMPNADIKDFYVQQMISGDQAFVALIRRTEADKWFAQLKAIGLLPVSLSLGPFVTRAILDSTDLYGEVVVFDGHQVSMDTRQEWIDHKYVAPEGPSKIRIQNEAVDSALLIPYAAAFQLLLNDRVEAVAAEAEPYADLLAQQKEQRVFQVNAVLALSVCFVLLLANLIVFSWLDTDNLQLSARVSQSQQSSQDVQLNSGRIREKEALLQELGWDGNKNKSLLIDQVAALLPADVKWTAVAVDPPAKGSGQQARTLTFSNGQISISGLADKVLSVNEWIARIRTKTWVKNAELEHYTFNNELNTGVFTLTIKYQ